MNSENRKAMMALWGAAGQFELPFCAHPGPSAEGRCASEAVVERRARSSGSSGAVSTTEARGLPTELARDRFDDRSLVSSSQCGWNMATAFNSKARPFDQLSRGATRDGE